MGQPILLLVTDQDRVLEALASDVGRRFGAEYRILVERSPVAALATLERLAAQSEEVALLIAAQRMREMTGVDFIVRAHELRDMLTRMGIPHGWYLADSQAGRELLQEAGQDGSRLPVVVFHSGRVFVDPSNAELAEGLGFGTQPAAAAYDLVIVGAGPAGLAAAVYAASEGLQTLVVEPRVVGG